MLFFLFIWVVHLEIGTIAFAGVSHDLIVRLEPEMQLLSGIDRITLSGESTHRVEFFLSLQARIRSLLVDGKEADFRVSHGQVTIVPTREHGDVHATELLVDYEAVFDDPFPEAPANTDNPGYGITGIIGRKGTFLLSGAGWYPVFPDPPSHLSLMVDAPKGMIAVTAGRSGGRKTNGERTRSFWEVDHPAGDLSLSAGPYIVTEIDSGNVQLATYFLPETQPLSDRYLAAVKRYLELYTELFGPYPFEKFAVVENFFPTGYGFPSYTLMGGTVLRLPFIIDVSLGHEIAHCWWGNGVLVDAASGNWCEGLTTYVADYRFKEMVSAVEAGAYRIQWLRNYATLVNDENDFPLSQFFSRKDRVTKVIGYDKAAMVFHMIRELVGESVFWGALRDLFEDKCFQRVSWGDLRIALERRSGHGPCCTLEEFFTQWIERPGAPKLALTDVRRWETKEGWKISGVVVQHQDELFTVPVTMTIETGKGPLMQMISIHDRKTPFSLRISSRPTALALDPDASLFRRLFPEEIPASINTLKGADSVSVVVSEAAGNVGMETARMLVRSLGLSRAEIYQETDVRPRSIEGNSQIYIGFPTDPTLFPRKRGAVTIDADRFSVAGQTFSTDTDTFFCVIEDPKDRENVVGILYPLHPQYGPLVARKATHYGKYSYLAFSKGQNRAKGIWPVTDSPLVVRWEPAGVEK